MLKETSCSCSYKKSWTNNNLFRLCVFILQPWNGAIAVPNPCRESYFVRYDWMTEQRCVVCLSCGFSLVSYKLHHVFLIPSVPLWSFTFLVVAIFSGQIAYLNGLIDELLLINEVGTAHNLTFCIIPTWKEFLCSGKIFYKAHNLSPKSKFILIRTNQYVSLHGIWE